MAKRALDLLNELMSGAKPSTQDLLDLLQSGEREHQWLEFKHGDKFEKSADPAKMIRRYITGFANADGGILVGGVTDDRKRVTGCKAVGGGDLEEWVSRCLDPVAPFFSPPPRIETLSHPDGEVLMVATTRAPGLISTDGVYYLRFHDQTRAAPDYLISDLVLGRRQHPILQLTDVEGIARRTVTDIRGLNLQFFIQGKINNVGMSWTEPSDIGLIGYSVGQQSSLNDGLKPFVTLAPLEARHTEAKVGLFHSVTPINSFRPFGGDDFHTNLDLMVPVSLADWQYLPHFWRAALYILTKGSPPIWFQVEVEVTTDLLIAIRTGHPALEVRVRRLIGERAEVSLVLPPQ